MYQCLNQIMSYLGLKDIHFSAQIDPTLFNLTEIITWSLISNDGNKVPMSSNPTGAYLQKVEQ